MERISSILLATASLLAMGFGCGRDCPTVELALNKELTATLQDKCRLLNLDRPLANQPSHVVPGVGSATDATEYVINSREELARWAASELEALDRGGL